MIKLAANSEFIFWFFAWAGTGMLIIQTVLSLVAADQDGDDHTTFEDSKFKWMTKQALTGFIMLFGWVGLACIKQFNLTVLISIFIGAAAGLIASFLASFIFHLAKKAHSPGTVFNLDEAIGKEGVVYHRIP